MLRCHWLSPVSHIHIASFSALSLDATAKLVRLELGPKAPHANSKPKSDSSGLARLSELKEDELEAFLKLKPGAGLAMSMELPHWTKVCISLSIRCFSSILQLQLMPYRRFSSPPPNLG
jgi:hypothetical protein